MFPDGETRQLSSRRWIVSCRGALYLALYWHQLGISCLRLCKCTISGRCRLDPSTYVEIFHPSLFPWTKHIFGNWHARSPVKSFRNLVSGEDDELTATIARFHKMVDQENLVVSNATLAKVGATHVDVKESLATAGRTEHDTETIIISTRRMDQYIECRVGFFSSPFLSSKFLR